MKILENYYYKLDNDKDVSIVWKKHDKACVLGLNKTYPSGIVYIDRLSGVPITEEWLLRFWFEKDVSFKIKINNLRLHLFQINASNKYNDNQNEFTVTVYQSKQSIEICRLKFVHQLQNLYYALTNNELILKPKDYE